MIEDNITDITTAPAEQPVPIIDEQTQQVDAPVTPDAPPPVEPEKPAVVLKDIDFFNNNVDWHNSNLAEGEKALKKYKFAQDIPDEEYNGLKGKVETETVNWHNKLSEKHPELKIGKIENAWDINKDNYDKLVEVDNVDRKQSELTQYNEIVKQLPSNSGIKPLKNVNDFTPELLDKAKAKYTEKVNLNLKKQGYTGEGFKDFGSIDWKLIDEYDDKFATEEENKRLRGIKSKYKSLSDVPEFKSKEDADARRSELNKKIKELDSQKTVSDWNEQAKTINAKFGVNVPIVKSESELPAANEKFKKIAAAYGNTATATPAYTKMEFPISPFATQPGGVRGDIPAPNLATEASQFNWQKKREDFLKESKKMFYQSKADKEFFSKSADLGISPESRTLVTGENIGAPLKWNVTIEDEVSGNDINDHKKQAYYRAASDQINSDISKLDEQIKATAEQIKTAAPDEQQAILEKRNRIIKARGILADKQHEFSSSRHEIRNKTGSTAGAFLYKIAESSNDMFAGVLHFAAQGLEFGAGWMASDDEWKSINKKISEFGANANTGAQLFFNQTPENVEDKHEEIGFLGGMVPYVLEGEIAIPMMFFSSFNSNTEKYKDLPSSQSFILNSLQSAASAYIMGKGLQVTKGHGVINSAVLNFVEQSTGKIKLSNLYPYLDKVIGATKKVGTTSLASGLSFAVLNPVGVATTASIDELNNAISKNKVDTQDFVEVISQMGESAVGGLKDGIILGGVMTPVNAYQTGKLNRSTFSDATKLRDQRVMSSNINIIKQAHANGKIDKQTASSAIKNLVDLRKSITSIDEKLSIPDQYEAWEIMQDNKRLDHESSGLSDFFKAPYEKQKQSNNEKLQNIAMKNDQVYQHEKEGGSSFVNGKNAMGSKGTSVSIFPERTVIIDRPLTQKDLDDFKEKNKDILEGNEDVLSVGTWKDGEGKTNIDISSVTPHAEAEELGKKYNQQAVFNLEKGTSVPTGGTGEEIEGLKSEAERIKDIREIAGRTKASEADFKPISLEEVTANLGENNKIIKAVRNGMSAVSGLSDKNNISINFHDTNTSMQSAMNKGGAADKEAKKTRGNFSYIRNDKGGWDMSIDINLKAGADATTIRHEFTHGVLLHAFGEAPEMINKMKDAFRSYGNMFNDSKLLKFADIYAKEDSAEEYLAELSAISKDIKPGALAKIAEFINNVAAKYLGDNFVPFKDVNDSNDIIRYFGSMANAVRTGAPVEIREMATKESENKAEDEVVNTKENEGPNSRQQRITAEDALLLDTSEKREKKKVTEVAYEFEKAVDKILAPSSEKEQRTQRFLVNAFQDLRYFLGEYKGDTGLDWYTSKIKEFGEKLKDISDIAIGNGELSADKSLRDKDNMDMFNVVLSLSSIGINPKENVKVAFEIWKNFDKNGMVFSKYRPGSVSFRTKVKQTNGAYWAPSGEIVKETKLKYVVKQSDGKIIEVKKSDLLPANEVVYNDVNKAGKKVEKTKELRLIKKTPTSYVFKSGDGIIKIPIDDVLSIEQTDDGLVGKGWSVKGNIVAINLERLESLMGTVGSIPKAIEWLSKKHPIEELRKYNSSLPDVDGKKGKTNNAGERLGSYIIGEKLGAFHQNVAGTPSELTMDLWWSRTWNRYMGTLMTVDEKGQPSIQETPRTDYERAVMRESAAIAAESLGLEVHELQAALWYLEQQVYKKMGAAVESYSFVDGVNSLLLKYGKTEQEIQPERYGINSSEVDTRRADAASRAANILYEGLGEKSETESREAPKSKQSLVDDAKMTKDMTEDEKGNYLFYHYSPGKIPNIDPRHFGKNLRTGRDERPGIGVSMYYTRPDRRDVGGSYGYVVRVPKDKVYPFNSDPLNLMDKAKATFEKMYPGQAFDKNKQVAFVSQEAAKAGYDMTVAKWGNDLRAQTTKVMKGETYEKPHPDYHTSTVFNPKLEKYVANENKPKSKQQVDAYHGSPHDFDEFKMEKIGTGEGAQAFGHGLYFTDLKRIGEEYAKKLSLNKKYSFEGIDNINNIATHPMTKAFIQDMLKSDPKNRTDAINWVRENSKGKSEKVISELMGFAKLLNIDNSVKGNLYNVTLHEGKTPEQYTWLEWDKELNEKQIQDLLDNDVSGEIAEALNYHYSENNDISTTKDLIDTMYNDSIDGKKLYNILSKNIGENPSSKNASMALLNAGIDGVKYPAESIARGATSENARGFNYVVFDEKAVTIKAKSKQQLVEEDYELSRDNQIDAEYDIQKGLGFRIGNNNYERKGDAIIRVKNHTPDWANFNSDLENDPSIKKVINVTVGDYENSDSRRNKGSLEQAKKEYPNVEFTDVKVKDGESINEAIQRVSEIVNSKIEVPKSKQQLSEEEKARDVEDVDLNNKQQVSDVFKKQWDAVNRGELIDNDGETFYEANSGIINNGLNTLTKKKWGHGSDRVDDKGSLEILKNILDGEDFKGDFGTIGTGAYTAREKGKFVVVTDTPESINKSKKLNPKEVEIILNDQLSPFGQALKNNHPDFVIKDYNGKEFKEQSLTEVPKSKQQLSSDDIRDNMDKMFKDYSKNMKGSPVEDVVNRVIDEVQHDWVKEGREIDLENAIRSFKEANGIKVKAPPSQAKISGEKPKKVTVNEYSSLKKQMELEIKAAREGGKSVVDAHKAIVELVKGNKDSFTRSDYEKIMDIMSNVKDEKSLNKAFDKIVEIEKNSKAGDIKEVSEFKELKEKVRLIYEAAKEGKKSVTDPLREIAAKLKEMEGRGKITANQAKALLNRFANVNTANPDMVDRYLDYAEKVFNDADYADKLNEAREINKKVKKAIKSREVQLDLRMAAKKFTDANVTKVEDIDAHLEMGRRLLDATSSSGIGIKEGEISDRTRKAINIKELSDYTDEVAQKIAEADEANLLEATGIDVKSEEPDTVAPSIEDYIRDRFNAMADSIRAMIKSGISPIDGEKYDLSDEDKIKLSKLVKMTADDIVDPKDKIRALEAMDHLLTNGVMGRIPYILNKIKMSKDVDRGINERLRVTSGKVGLLAIENAVQGIRKILSFSGNSKFYHALLRNSTRRIDNVIKNYKGFEIFNNGIKQIAQGESSYKTDLNTMNSDKLKNELVKSMGGDFNRVIESGFKMTMYLRQLEHESNPGSKKSPPAMAFVEKTIEASMSGKHPMNEKSAKLLKKLSELYSTDGNIDSKKIWDSFSPAEKKVVEGIRKLYDALTPYAQKVASEIHDQPFDPFENYTTIVTQNTSRGAEQVLNEKGKLNAAIGITPAGSIKTKAGQIEERTGQASAINFDPFSSANKAVRNVMLDYHMTLPLRTMNKITDGFIAKSLEMYKADPSKENESRLLFAKAMRKTFEDVLEATLSRSFFHRDIWSDVKDYVSRASTTYMLSNPSKAASEAVSNLSYVVPNYPEEMALGITEYKDYSLNGVGGEIMRNLNSYATDRAYPHGTLSGAFLSPESYEISTNDMQNVRGFAVNAATKAYYNSLMAPQKGLRAVSETMMTAPDLAIIRPLWFGSMAKSFKKITGQDIDFEAIAKNDVNYLDKFEDALNKSRDIADKNVTDTGAAKNPWLMSPITVKRHGTLLGQTQNYLANYSRNEYEITTDAIIAMHRGGKISRADAAKQISGVLLRAGTYTAIRGVIASGLAAAGIAMHHFLYDDDDKDELTQAITEGKPDSKETRKIAAKNQINFLTKTSPRIPGIDPSIDLNNVMMTSDKNKFTMKELQERASDENTFSDNFIKGVGSFVAQGVLGRNFGNIQNRFFTSTAVEYLNAKYLHPDDYNRYKNNILYSSWPDFNSKDAYQKTVEAAVGPYGKASSAAWAVGTSINDYLESQSKIKAIDENLRKIESGEKVPFEQSGLDYRDKLIKEKNKLIKENKKNVPAYFRDAIISGLATMGALPGAKDFENVMTKAMKPTMVELSDYDELKEKYKFYKGSVKGTIWGTPGEKDDRESEYYKMTHAGFDLTPEGWIKK